MPAFRLTAISLEPDGKGETISEYFFDNGSTAYIHAAYIMILCAEYITSKHHAQQLLCQIETHLGDLNPVIEFYNRWSSWHKIKVERLNFEDKDNIPHVSKQLIEEARQRVSTKDYGTAKPVFIVIKKGPSPEELREMHQQQERN